VKGKAGLRHLANGSEISAYSSELVDFTICSKTHTL
jgi:hypothetical protein